MLKVFKWPEPYIAAVSLTYDDALPIHWRKVAPRLERGGIYATFYCPVIALTSQDVAPWRELSEHGHEIGNHTLFHPCVRNEERKSWLAPWQDLAGYSIERWQKEIEVANYTLSLIDGKRERTFGNTCCDNVVGQGSDQTSLDALIRNHFVAGRGNLTNRVINPGHADLSNLGCFCGDGRTAQSIVSEISETVSLGGWYIIMIHGVGKGTHSWHIDSVEHEYLVSHLSDILDTVWIAPVLEVAKYVAGVQSSRARQEGIQRRVVNLVSAKTCSTNGSKS